MERGAWLLLGSAERDSVGRILRQEPVATGCEGESGLCRAVGLEGLEEISGQEFVGTATSREHKPMLSQLHNVSIAEFTGDTAYKQRRVRAHHYGPGPGCARTNLQSDRVRLLPPAKRTAHQSPHSEDSAVKR